MLQNVLIVVKDIEKSRKFYKKYFGLLPVKDFGEVLMLTEGLVLQEQSSWEALMATPMVVGTGSELFFKETFFDMFLKKITPYLQETGQEISIRSNAWGKRTIFVRDPDGHLLEISE